MVRAGAASPCRNAVLLHLVWGAGAVDTLPPPRPPTLPLSSSGCDRRAATAAAQAPRRRAAVPFFGPSIPIRQRGAWRGLCAVVWPVRSLPPARRCVHVGAARSP